MIDQRPSGVKKTSGSISDSIHLPVQAVLKQLGEDRDFCCPAETCLPGKQGRHLL